jgi:hypothetical protein
MLEVRNETLGITVSNGYMVIQNSHGSITVKEQPLEKFEKFYQAWQCAMIIGGSDSFATSWTNNQSFQTAIKEAVGHLGIEKPELLTPGQLEALLISYQNGPELIPGILFGLHHTFPKLDPSMTKTEQPLRMSLKWLLTLIVLMLLDTISQTSWKNHTLLKSGLYLLSCVIWLINSLIKLTPLSQLEINIKKPNGKNL